MNQYVKVGLNLSINEKLDSLPLLNFSQKEDLKKFMLEMADGIYKAGYNDGCYDKEEGIKK